jgi:hypothetical protein
MAAKAERQGGQIGPIVVPAGEENLLFSNQLRDVLPRV